jgi:hypothetical protein
MMSNGSDVKDVGSELWLAYSFKVNDDESWRNKSRNGIYVQLIDGPKETGQWILERMICPNKKCTCFRRR